MRAFLSRERPRTRSRGCLRHVLTELIYSLVLGAADVLASLWNGMVSACTR
jgi:hypothetical protein